MTSEGPYTDIRLIPITAEHYAALISEDPALIVAAVMYVRQSYEKAPPLTFNQAIAYSTDVEWWRDEISDL